MTKLLLYACAVVSAVVVSKGAVEEAVVVCLVVGLVVVDRVVCLVVRVDLIVVFGVVLTGAAYELFGNNLSLF